MDDGRCHICRRWPVRADLTTYGVTTCFSCEETAAVARAADGGWVMKVLIMLLLGAGVVLVAMGPRDCRDVPVRVGGMTVAEFCGPQESEHDK